MQITNNYNSIPVMYEGGCSQNVVKTDETGTQRFDRALMGMKPATLPSCVAKVYTKEELMQAVDDQVQQNQSKKLSLSELIEKTCINARSGKFKFVGEDRIYSFDEFIAEHNRRSEEYRNKH